MRKNELLKSLCILLAVVVISSGFLLAFSVRITVKGGCGSSFEIGESLAWYVDLSDGAYVNIWVVTSGGSWDIMRNTYLCAGTHTFSGTVSGPEGTHTVNIEARDAYYGTTAYDSCSYYVTDTSPTPTPPSPTSEPKRTDSDGDGVSDSNDKCNNPGCMIVDSRGCPKDSDDDGLRDCDDECHNPGCYEVDSRGCPKDSDDDGLRDCDDECDFTPGPRSNNGCPEEPEEETDSDGDGWSDEQEQRAGTNPYNVDTDGDDIWDPQDPSPLKAEEKESSLSSGLVIIGFILGLRSLRRK